MLPWSPVFNYDTFQFPCKTNGLYLQALSLHLRMCGSAVATPVFHATHTTCNIAVRATELALWYYGYNQFIFCVLSLSINANTRFTL